MSFLRLAFAACLVAGPVLALAQAAPEQPAPGLTPTAASAPADPDTVFKGRMGGTFGKNVTEVMPQAKRIALPAFRVAFIVDNSVTAQVRAAYLPGMDYSGARSSLFLALQGVTPQAMQAIVDNAYTDLVAQLAATGREVVKKEEMQEFFSTVKASASSSDKPYTKEHNGQTAMIFSPSGMPLVFSHFDTGWGDSGFLDLNNYRRLQEFSSKWNAAVLMPLVVINFAQMRSSGNQSGLVGRAAETGAELKMSVAGMSTLYLRTTEFRNGMGMGGDEGSFSLATPVVSTQDFATYRETSNDNNASVKATLDVIGKVAAVASMGRLGGLANLGGAARSSTKAVAETSDSAYTAAAVDALTRANATLGSWFRKYPAAQ